MPRFPFWHKASALVRMHMLGEGDPCFHNSVNRGPEATDHLIGQHDQHEDVHDEAQQATVDVQRQVPPQQQQLQAMRTLEELCPCLYPKAVNEEKNSPTQGLGHACIALFDGNEPATTLHDKGVDVCYLSSEQNTGYYNGGVITLFMTKIRAVLPFKPAAIKSAPMSHPFLQGTRQRWQQVTHPVVHHVAEDEVVGIRAPLSNGRGRYDSKCHDMCHRVSDWGIPGPGGDLPHMACAASPPCVPPLGQRELMQVRTLVS